jgi:hypothetical protein
MVERFLLNEGQVQSIFHWGLVLVPESVRPTPANPKWQDTVYIEVIPHRHKKMIPYTSNLVKQDVRVIC